MNKSLVSVIIPTYNRKKTIVSAVKSVLDQTYDNLELIVVDDGSTDNTREILSEIKDHRLRYIYQENGGACKARNTGIDNAKGDYIAFHDSDDLWLSNKLEVQMDVMLKNDVDLVTCRLNRLSDGITPTITSGHIIDNPLTQISTQTLLVKKEVTTKVRFDERLKRFQDLDFVINTYINGYKLYLCDEALVTWSYNDDSITANNIKKTDAMDIIIDKYQDQIKELKSTFFGIYCDRAQVNLNNNNNKAALEDFKSAYSLNKNYKTLIRIILMKVGVSSLMKSR